MNKLGMKLNVTGWVVFAISFMATGSWHDWVQGIAVGFFISSAWVAIIEYKNQ